MSSATVFDIRGGFAHRQGWPISTASHSPARMLAQDRGFTLLELLVALVVFAVMSAMAYSGLNRILSVRDHLEAESRQWRELTLVLGRMEEDISQSVNRTWLDSFGTRRPAMIGRPQLAGPDDVHLSLIRMGAGGSTGLAADMSHVGYRLQDGQLELLQWPALDLAPRATPVVHVLLHGIKGFELVYLTEQGIWESKWEPDANASALPRAVQIRLTLPAGGQVRRVVALQ